jgi:phosphopantothenoylcysteine synthetase/decarboxylase
MPLNTSQKINHLKNVINLTYAGRQKTVVFVYLASGVYSYVATQVIMRPEEIIDPQIYDASGHAPVTGTNADMIIIAPLGTNFTGVVYIADTPTATAAAVAAAPKYEVIEALPVGMIPGGSHIRALLRRLR